MAKDYGHYSSVYKTLNYFLRIDYNNYRSRRYRKKLAGVRFGTSSLHVRLQNRILRNAKASGENRYAPH